VRDKSFFLKLALLFLLSMSMPVLAAVNEPAQLKKNVLTEPPKEDFLQRVDRLLRSAIPVQKREEETLDRRMGIYNSHGQAAAPGTDAMALRSVLWFYLGLIAVVGVFLLVSTGGFKQPKQKLGDFRNKEFANTLGLPDGEKRNRQADDCCADRKAEDGKKDGG